MIYSFIFVFFFTLNDLLVFVFVAFNDNVCSCYPGLINNAPLLKGILDLHIFSSSYACFITSTFIHLDVTNELIEHLNKGVDYILVPEEAWILLVK